jgi:predicted DNA-binding protein
VSYVNYSIHLPDPKLLKRIKAAAKRQGTTVSSFIRSAAEKEVERHEKKLEKKQVAA